VGKTLLCYGAFHSVCKSFLMGFNDTMRTPIHLISKLMTHNTLDSF